MGLLLFLGAVILSGIILVAGLITALVANAKGYRPWFWILAMGPIGLIVMVVRKSLDRATTPEERERWQAQADWTGGILSGLTFVAVFAFPILGMATFIVTRAAVIPPPPMVTPPPIAPPVTVTPQVAPEATDELSIDSPAPAGTPEQVQDPATRADESPKAP